MLILTLKKIILDFSLKRISFSYAHLLQIIEIYNNILFKLYFNNNLNHILIKLN